MKRTYEKPTIGSERVFSLASQGCDVNRDCPGTCQTGLMYEECYPFSWKVQNIACGLIPANPVEKS